MQGVLFKIKACNYFLFTVRKRNTLYVFAFTHWWHASQSQWLVIEKPILQNGTTTNIHCPVLATVPCKLLDNKLLHVSMYLGYDCLKVNFSPFWYRLNRYLLRTLTPFPLWSFDQWHIIDHDGLWCFSKNSKIGFWKRSRKVLI